MRLDEPHRRVAQFIFAAHRITCDEYEREHARQLGCLEVEAEQANPAAAAIDDVPQARDQHDEQQTDRNDEQRPGHFLEVFGADAEHSSSQHKADEAQHQLAFEIRKRVAGFLAGDRDRCRRDHDQAQQHDGGHERERDHVEMQATGAGAHVALLMPSSSFTARRTRCRGARSRGTCRGSSTPGRAAPYRRAARSSRRRGPLLPCCRRAPCRRCRRARSR